MAEATAHILLATYNGARFLPAQLESLAAQDDPDWRLFVRDDGSEDGTRELLATAAARDERIRVIDDGRARLGSSGSFFALMEHAREAGASMFALCDQDDVWAPHKLRRMRAALAQFGAPGQDVPALVYSDLAWIDGDGEVLARSHFDRAGLAAALDGPDLWLLAMNAIPGCAMAGNRALLNAALPAPAGVVHHDWWLVVVAAAAGRVGVIREALVHYRQHDDNLIGARPLASRVTGAMRAPRSAIASGRRVFWQAVAQARALDERISARDMDPAWHAACRHVVDELGAASRTRRAAAVLRGPVRRIGFLRTLLMLASAVSSRDSLIE